MARYRFRFVACDEGFLRTFAGSAWRGAFGGALKRVVCAMRLRPCEGCPLAGTCIYPHLFEGRQGADPVRLKSLDRIAVPYVFELDDVVPRSFGAGSEVTVTLTLIGDANRRLARSYP
ncbi:hypothetical protein FHP25_14590 [Vineibacter terrae]|uniref:Uncharacterized protein n=1 Tax=Vineibacter terrae TaxID=2586908 RepID=A0A5C8PMC8_9HYPH|nr:hypothetical protein [Vineibacter terrae]TXL75464.1 hypothetical protein FHP25_14590 [Vineibacter terrae]